ncbi:hypothetical protein [Agrobacterium vitis]|uniref:hypothetical protein n=1 Tax=Agrobacterium vitis TaxID=373 RepID=UPI001F422BAE|nr:hypothetical protein [Agrobacterium vitis]
MTYSETTPSYGASSSNTITAFFENRSDAEAAVERLVEAGILRDGIALWLARSRALRPTRSPRARAFGRS